jgi:hypothetical protein
VPGLVANLHLATRFGASAFSERKSSHQLLPLYFNHIESYATEKVFITHSVSEHDLHIVLQNCVHKIHIGTADEIAPGVLLFGSHKVHTLEIISTIAAITIDFLAIHPIMRVDSPCWIM